ncbi:hypothetical protein PV10_05886 [Exophiala mesophila]|uniref:Oxidoreductase n=1 Tax=Exophiala mesophila TaxID=212818 RepID=A0A0D1ZBI7_EXOME|nr:uncharacterized protein PV10_05886 [Exophiala mesophila]KIV91339.1 hypothetical protein PV10_05886 [Exophiala mesophila]
MTFHPDELPDLSGKVYLVTGGNSGIGYFTVARLAQHGAHVYMGVRSVEKGSAAVKDIKKLYPNAKISLLEINHMSLDSVVAAAKLFISKEPALHGLINNAGIMATPFEISSDGYEAQFQTNYLAHWLLTTHLLPLLLKTSKTTPAGGVRIVNLSSAGHASAPSCGINFADPALTKSDPGARYGQSKLANILHTKILSDRYGPNSPSAKAGNGEVWTTSVHPGLVETNLANNSKWPFPLGLILNVARPLGFFFDADKGSWTSVYCAASPKMPSQDCGAYFIRIAKNKGGWRSGPSKNAALATKLEEWTSKELNKNGWLP